MLHFKDGITINTSGKVRSLKLDDGWYVVGEGMCIPVSSHKEAKEIIENHETHKTFNKLSHDNDGTDSKI